MAELGGQLMVVKIGLTSCGSFTTINGVDNATLRRLCNILDFTNFGHEYKTRGAGIKDTSVALAGNYDPDDPNGQLVLEPGDTVFVQVLPDGSIGKQIEMIVENFEQTAAADGKQTFSSSLQGVNAPTEVPGAAPVIATVCTIPNGTVTPDVAVTGSNFKEDIAVGDLTVGVDTTGLTFSDVTYIAPNVILLAFTGTAAAGDVTIQAKTSAYDPATALPSNTLTIVVPAE